MLYFPKIWASPTRQKKLCLHRSCNSYILKPPIEPTVSHFTQKFQISSTIKKNILATNNFESNFWLKVSLGLSLGGNEVNGIEINFNRISYQAKK
jgi:hypothetical protein